MKTITVTLQERWAASQHKVHKSKKTYDRKDKHKKRGSKQDPFFFLLQSSLSVKLKLSVKVLMEVKVLLSVKALL